jgi:hypothetical protein
MRTSTGVSLMTLAIIAWCLVLLGLPGCASAPPGTYGVNAFGFGVSYSTPGWSAPVPVVKSAIITTPTLMVPENSPAANADTATSATGVVVPVVVAPVKTETLAVPAK